MVIPYPCGLLPPPSRWPVAVPLSLSYPRAERVNRELSKKKRLGHCPAWASTAQHCWQCPGGTIARPGTLSVERLRNVADVAKGVYFLTFLKCVYRKSLFLPRYPDSPPFSAAAGAPLSSRASAARNRSSKRSYRHYPLSLPRRGVAILLRITTRG